MNAATRTSLGLALVWGLMVPISVAEAQDGRGDPVNVGRPAALEVQVEGDEFLLRLEDGVPFHRSIHPIRNERVVPAPGTTLTLALWDEEVNGQSQAHYAISRDGLTFSRARATSYELRLRDGRFDPLAAVASVPPLLESPLDSELHLVQFVVQPMPEFVAEITRLGGTVRKYVPHHAYVVSMSPQVGDAVEALPYVRWVGPCHPAYRLERSLVAGLSGTGADLPTQRYVIQVFEKDSEQKSVVADAIGEMGGMVHDFTPGGLILEATLTPQQLLGVAGMDEVSFIELWGPAVPAMNNVRVIGGANYLESVGGYTGAGVRGEVMDNGCLTTHQDFSGRISIRRGPVVVESHGTATFGIVFGSGAGSSTARGMMPTAQGIFSMWSPPNSYTDMGVLVGSPWYCVFQSNSWGSGPFTREYSSLSVELDEAVFDFDIVVLQAQGNYDNQDSLQQSWGKNIVCVGGVYHYDDQNLGNDQWDGPGSNASIGPASDGRVKPDLCYYYDAIRTTTSSGGYTNSMGGTSAATPETAGHFGLFFQMWADGAFRNRVSGGTVFEERPHAATAKAVMINTANEYSFSGTSHDLTRVHQGWGRSNVQNLYDNRNSILIVDETDVIEEFGSTQYHRPCAGGDGPLRVTLVYTDPAGVAWSAIHRVNDLTLKVTSPSSTVYYGNNGLLEGNWSTSGGSPNTIDTVENVFIENPEAGEWTVEVLADEINEDGHPETPEMDADYALVVTGGFFDCNLNDVSDQDDIDQGTSPDCNTNRIPDECEIEVGTPGGSYYCTGECDPDCNTNGIPDVCEADCNVNDIPDQCDITVGTSTDCDVDGVPDECEPDCNANEVADDCDITAGTSPDGNGNDVPDECEALTLYVHETAVGGDNGTNWTDAYHDLYKAMAVAATPGNAVTEIWVAAGTYYPDAGTGERDRSFVLKNGLALYGGFAGGESSISERDPAANPAVLNGDLAGDDTRALPTNEENSYHVVVSSGTDASAILDGFVITGGNADSAAFPHFNGGGILNDTGSPTINDCAIVANTAISGGGMHNDDGAPAVTNCLFGGNRSTGNGGGFYNTGGSADPLLEQCSFTANSAATDGGGVYNIGSGADLALINCALVRNAAGAHGGGVRSFYAGVTTLTNGILWANDDGGPSDQSAQIKADGTAAAVNYTCVQYLSGLGGAGNIGGAPAFIDVNGSDNQIGTADDDLRRGAGSACTDAGDNGAAGQAVDAAGNPRFAEDPIAPNTGSGTPPLVDMGPYEYQDDCNTNGVIDSVDLDVGTSADCNDNGVPDECEPPSDCNTNAVQDICDIALGTSGDCDTNGVPDECEPGCNDNGVPDACDIAVGTSMDCNTNAIPDECDIAEGTSLDCTGNGVPDECEPDCNTNGVADSCDILASTSTDGDVDGVPDECQGVAEVHSVHEHGAAGEFALLLYDADGSAVNIEPRLSGGGRLEVTFEIEMDPVTATDPDHVSIVGVNSGPYAGSVNVSLDGTGTVVIIEPLGSLPEADCYTVDLTGMTSLWGASPINRAFTFTALTGDTDLSETVNTADMSSIKQRLGLTTTAALAPYDVNHDGVISTADISSAKARIGTVSPDCP